MAGVSFKDFLIKSRMDFKKASLYQEAYDKIMETGFFDKEFYLNAYPHIAKSNMDPLVHYMFFGYKEGKFPSLYFDVAKYIEQCPEVENNGLNPLVHYVLYGKDAGIKIAINPVESRYNKIVNTNLLFLNNYNFDGFEYIDSEGNKQIGEPLVSILILNRDGLKHLKELFKEFDEKTNYSNYEIIVVDNASSDGSIEYLESLTNLPITLIKNEENVSFSKGNNDASKIAKGEYLLLLNNDMEPTYGWLNELVGTFVNGDNVGAVGSKLVFPYYYNMFSQNKSFTIQHAGVKFREQDNPYIYGPYHEHIFSPHIFDRAINKTKECVAVTAAAVLFKKSIYEELGGLDEGYFYGYEDVDFMFKLSEAGYKIIYSPAALLFHHESPTRHKGNYDLLNERNISRLSSKWGNFLFKSLLKDKLDVNLFFTEKRLKIIFIADNLDNDFNEDINTKNEGLFDQTVEVNDFLNQSNVIPAMIKIFNMKNYNSGIISDLNDNDLGDDTDIVISLSLEYNIKNAMSRSNLIKILWISEENYNSSTGKEIKRIEDYDIVLSINQYIIHQIKEQFNTLHCFLLDESKLKYYDDYVDEILGIIRKVYLD